MEILNKIDDRKAIIDKARPFEGELLKQLKGYYRVGLTYSSNALEGNEQIAAALGGVYTFGFEFPDGTKI